MKQSNTLKPRTRFLIATFLMITCLSAMAMNYGEVIDYLSAGKQLKFKRDSYSLAWSSHPSANYYKHEYLKDGESLSSYHNMLLLESTVGDFTIEEALNAKAAELNTRKKWDFVANYNVYENKEKPTEGIIDFVVSDTSTTYEWNLYRYQIQESANNKSSMVLFAYSYRDSLNDDNDLKKFFDRIKSKRTAFINELSGYSIPKVEVGN